MVRVLSVILIIFCNLKAQAQSIELFQQFNGRYDYLAIGNTLNIYENNLDQDFCSILPSSQATLELPENTTIVAAYLYWAGSGQADENVKLNDSIVTAAQAYYVNYDDSNYGTLNYFSCYADVTDLITDLGNTTYEFSELDISEALASNPGYCNNRTNFAGWSVYLIYEDENLPLNQISLFQGLDIINRNNQEKTIILDNINVLDNEGAKIGFLAWEGDTNLNYGESLLLNGNILSNPPLNPANNAFNGTNSFTNSSTFYNGDLDVYNIQNNIDIGDTSATIKLTTGDYDANGNLLADLIILNNIITVLNSQLPDATVQIDNVPLDCGSRVIELEYTIYNTNATDPLPANTPIAIYIEGELVGTDATFNTLPIDGLEQHITTITVPSSVESDFTVVVHVDDNGSGQSTVTEINENNNSNSQSTSLINIPPPFQLTSLTACDEGYNTAHFNLWEGLNDINMSLYNDYSFYPSLEDLEGDTNEITNPSHYQNISFPQTIAIKLFTDICYEIAQFDLLIENCPPTIPEVFTPNNDSYNDWFNIQGLYNIFEEHQLLIYNRYGVLIFEGNNNNHWDGRANRGIGSQNELVPVGTYFYVLYLNDPNYKPINGWVYLTY